MDRWELKSASSLQNIDNSSGNGKHKVDMPSDEQLLVQSNKGIGGVVIKHIIRNNRSEPSVVDSEWPERWISDDNDIAKAVGFLKTMLHERSQKSDEPATVGKGTARKLASAPAPWQWERDPAGQRQGRRDDCDITKPTQGRKACKSGWAHQTDHKNTAKGRF